MPATPSIPRRADAMACAALDMLIDAGDAVSDDDDDMRGFAFAQTLRSWEMIGADAPTWTAIATIIPPRPGERVDAESERLRTTVVPLLDALWAAEYERREERTGISLRSFTKLR